MKPDSACPLLHMTASELRSSCFRVLYYENRIAVECFHAVTDGTGGMVFLKTLTAEYLSRRYGIRIPPDCGLPDRSAAPLPEELEDSFHRTAGPVGLSRREENALRLRGIREPDRFLHLTVATVSEQALLDKAHEYGCTVTSLLCAVMLQTILELIPHPPRGRWAKISVPVNLRKVLGGSTMRNFVLAVNVGVDPRLGSYTLQDLTRVVQSQLNTLVTPQQMAARVAANVQPARMYAVRMMPLPVKNAVMRLVYHSIGESKGTINISNLGRNPLPAEMSPYVRYLDFVIGPQISYDNNCGVASCGGFTRISLIRSTVSPELERVFLTKLVELGLEVTVESNERS